MSCIVFGTCPLLFSVSVLVDGVNPSTIKYGYLCNFKAYKCFGCLSVKFTNPSSKLQYALFLKIMENLSDMAYHGNQKDKKTASREVCPQLRYKPICRKVCCGKLKPHNTKAHRISYKLHSKLAKMIFLSRSKIVE